MSLGIDERLWLEKAIITLDVGFLNIASCRNAWFYIYEVSFMYVDVVVRRCIRMQVMKTLMLNLQFIFTSEFLAQNF